MTEVNFFTPSELGCYPYLSPKLRKLRWPHNKQSAVKHNTNGQTNSQTTSYEENS